MNISTYVKHRPTLLEVVYNNRSFSRSRSRILLGGFYRYYCTGILITNITYYHHSITISIQ